MTVATKIGAATQKMKRKRNVEENEFVASLSSLSSSSSRTSKLQCKQLWLVLRLLLRRQFFVIVNLYKIKLRGQSSRP